MINKILKKNKEITLKVKQVGKRYSILASDGVVEERIVDVHNSEDALIFMFFSQKFLKKEFDESELAEFIKNNSSKFPFITVPTE